MLEKVKTLTLDLIAKVLAFIVSAGVQCILIYFALAQPSQADIPQIDMLVGMAMLLSLPNIIGIISATVHMGLNTNIIWPKAAITLHIIIGIGAIAITIFTAALQLIFMSTSPGSWTIDMLNQIIHAVIVVEFVGDVILFWYWAIMSIRVEWIN